MESPLHIVNWRYPKAASEYKCQLPGGPPTQDSFCPSYRGPYFRDEVRRIADHMLMIGGADMVMWDWELPGPALWLGATAGAARPSSPRRGCLGRHS